jgi:hypothetical protein
MRLHTSEKYYIRRAGTERKEKQQASFQAYVIK